MTYCYVCPHRCGVDRPESLQDPAIATGEHYFGSCGCAMLPLVARAGLHHWEEPPISGTRGSGTVFFAGCNLHCVFCQNYDISHHNKGKEISIERLQQIYQELIAQGAHNINLVTGTHFTEAIVKSLAQPLSVPVVYNTSGYETQDTLRKLKGKVQIYLPDLKYYNDKPAIKYSNANYYFRTATEAIKEMHRQVGDYAMDEDGIMQKGIIIRHLLMPGLVEDSKKIIDWVASTFKPGQVMFSLMHQYIPHGRASEYPEINRKVTDEEYAEVEDYLMNSDIEDGFVQDGDAACEEFIPTFDGTGV